MPFYLGLDCEMTGTNMDAGHELCQVGAATESGEVFVSEIHCNLINVDTDSMAVHGIDPGWLKEGAPRASVVDDRLAYFIQQSMGNRHKAVPVGWGVSYFDMPWVRKYLPRTAAMLSRRSVELGSVCYTVGVTFGLSPDVLKRRAKRYAEDELTTHQGPARWHNAGFDAQAALLSWQYLMAVMKEGRYPS